MLPHAAAVLGMDKTHKASHARGFGGARGGIEVVKLRSPVGRAGGKARNILYITQQGAITAKTKMWPNPEK